MSEIEKRLEKATRERQSILDKAKNVGSPDRTVPYNDAVEFVLTAGVLPTGELRRLAVRHGAVLLEMLEGSPEVLQFFSNKQIDYRSIAANIRDILHSLHFNRDDDFYLSLLLPSDADEYLINRRWKALMRLYHPDRNHGGIVLPADYAAESTKRLNEIYNVLKDHRRKFKYDQLYGLHDGQGIERPSFFTKPCGKATIFSSRLKYYWALAGIFAVILAAAASGTLYLRIPARHPVVSLGAPRLENKAADSILPLKNNAEDSVSASGLSSDGTAADAREIAGPTSLKQDVSLAEDVYGFISRFESAFKHGDLEAYLSCYSALAKEDSMNHDRIREYYKNLFGRGRNSLSMRNMIISEEGNSIMVRGLWAIIATSEGRAGKELRGSYTMRIRRENGRLKILDLRKGIDKSAAD
jgi:curved DNA-binding protein CbpA